MNTSSTPLEEQSHRRLSYRFLAIGFIFSILTYLIGFNDNPLGIASAILGASLLMLGIFFRFTKSGGRRPHHELLYWAPKILVIVIALFGSIFAIDALKGALKGGQNFLRTAPGELEHLIPSFLILAVLAVSWHREWIGGVICFGLAVFLNWYLGPPDRSLLSFDPLLTVPFVLLGIWFLLNWRYRGVLRGNSSTPLWLLPAVVALGFVVVTILVFVFP